MVAAAPHAISSRMTPSDWAQLLLLSLIWGGSFCLTGIAVKGLPVLTLVAVRVFVAALVLWAVVWARGTRVPRAPAVWGMFLVMGALNNAVPFMLIAGGEDVEAGAFHGLLLSSPQQVLQQAGLATRPGKQCFGFHGLSLCDGDCRDWLCLRRRQGLGQSHAVRSRVAAAGGHLQVPTRRPD